MTQPVRLRFFGSEEIIKQLLSNSWLIGVETCREEKFQVIVVVLISISN